MACGSRLRAGGSGSSSRPARTGGARGPRRDTELTTQAGQGRGAGPGPGVSCSSLSPGKHTAAPGSVHNDPPEGGDLDSGSAARVAASARRLLETGGPRAAAIGGLMACRTVVTGATGDSGPSTAPAWGALTACAVLSLCLSLPAKGAPPFARTPTSLRPGEHLQVLLDLSPQSPAQCQTPETSTLFCIQRQPSRSLGRSSGGPETRGSVPELGDPSVSRGR